MFPEREASSPPRDAGAQFTTTHWSVVVAAGKGKTSEVLQGFELGGQSALSYAEAAASLGVSQSAVKSMIHRLRQRHRELVREQIAQTVPTVAEIDEELRHLVAALRG
jgi:RNA polymerase sigma-70 factor (ECF subfamily)